MARSSSPAPSAPTGAKGPVRIGRLIGGIALCALGLLVLLGGIGATVYATWDAKRDPLDAIVAPGELRLDADDGRTYIIALANPEDSWRDFESHRSERWEKYRVYEGEVNAMRCTIDHPSGKDERVRGDRQAVSSTVGTSYATVGRFEGRGGETRITCEFDPPTETRFASEDDFGARKVERSAPAMVHTAGGTVMVVGWVLVGAGVLLILLGVLQILRATVWRQPTGSGGSGAPPTAQVQSPLA